VQRQMNRTTALSVLFVGMILVLGSSSWAEIVRVAPPTQTGSTLAAPNGLAFDDKHGVYLHVWGITPGTGVKQVYGRFVRSDGTAVGQPFPISAAQGLYGMDPRVAYSSGAADDVFLVVFSSDRNAPDKAKNLFGQLVRYTDSGPQLVGENFPISPSSSNPGVSQAAGGICFNPNTRQFLVTWDSGPANGYDVFIRLFSTAGAPVGDEINVTAVPFWQGAPNVALDPTANRYLIVWQGEHPSSSVILGSWAKVVDGTSAQPLTGIIEVSRGGFQAQENTFFLPERHAFLVCWTDIQGAHPPLVTSVAGRLVDSNGGLQSDVYPVIDTPYFEGSPEGMYNPVTKTALVAAIHDSLLIWASELNELGQPVSTFQASSVTPPKSVGSFWPRVAVGSNGQFGIGFNVDYTATWVERLQGTPVAPPPPPPSTTYTLTVITAGQSQVFQNIAAGTVRTIQPDAAAIPQGSVFAGWAGPADCADSSVTMTADITCTAVLHTVLPAQSGTVWARALDFTGDHAGDLFLYDNATGSWSLAHSDGQAGFTLMKGLWTTPNLQIKGASLNSDGLTDFVIYCSTTGRWWQAINNGTGGFSYTTATWGPDWTISVGRFNDDAFDDVFVYKPSTGEWAITLADGAGGFSIATPVVFNPPTWNVTVVDLNGDGTSDLFLYNPTTGEWWKGLNTGTGTFAWSDHGTWSPGWTVKAGDFDGDGRGDIFVYNSTWGYWYVCLSTTPTAFAYHGEQWSAGWQVHVSNLNADAFDDLFVYNPANGYWYECFSNGTGGFTYFGERFNPPNWDLSVSEFNGDGLSDLFIYNKSTGEWRAGLNVKGVNPGQVGGFIWSSPATWSAGLTVMSGR